MLPHALFRADDFYVYYYFLRTTGPRAGQALSGELADRIEITSQFASTDHAEQLFPIALF